MFRCHPQFTHTTCDAWRCCCHPQFWTDILKGFGTAPDISTWASQFKDGFICFVNQEAGTDRCKYTALAAVVFTISYSLTYLCGSKMMKLTSANYQGMLSSVINPLAVVFWLIFTGLNTYAGGANYVRVHHPPSRRCVLACLCAADGAALCGFSVAADTNGRPVDVALYVPLSLLCRRVPPPH